MKSGIGTFLIAAIVAPLLFAVNELDWNVVVSSTERVVLALVAAWGGYKLHEISNTGKKTHNRVNSGWLIQLKAFAVSQRHIALLTHDPIHIAAAEVAEKAVADEEASQLAETKVAKV